MVNESPRLITALLKEWSNGDEYALEELMPLVYEDMRQMARKLIRRQSSGHTFQTIDLIHEAYLKFPPKSRATGKTVRIFLRRGKADAPYND